MKAVLVIDMPNDMEIKDTKALHITLFNGLFTKDISINCPLRPFSYKNGALGSVINPQGFTLSTASELLDEITGETDADS